MSDFLLVLLLGLAVARATRLYRDDSMTEGLRERVTGWLDYHGTADRHRPRRWRHGFDWLSEMLGCPWCLSGWLSILAVVVVDSATSRSVPVPFLSWLAVWWVSNIAYWLVELVADRDALAYWERKNKGIG